MQPPTGLRVLVPEPRVGAGCGIPWLCTQCGAAHRLQRWAALSEPLLYSSDAWPLAAQQQARTLLPPVPLLPPVLLVPPLPPLPPLPLLPPLASAVTLSTRRARLQASVTGIWRTEHVREAVTQPGRAIHATAPHSPRWCRSGRKALFRQLPRQAAGVVQAVAQLLKACARRTGAPGGKTGAMVECVSVAHGDTWISGVAPAPNAVGERDLQARVRCRRPAKHAGAPRRRGCGPQGVPPTREARWGAAAAAEARLWAWDGRLSRARLEAPSLVTEESTLVPTSGLLSDTGRTVWSSTRRTHASETGVTPQRKREHCYRRHTRHSQVWSRARSACLKPRRVR